MSSKAKPESELEVHPLYPYLPGTVHDMTCWPAGVDDGAGSAESSTIQATVRRTLHRWDSNGCVMLADIAGACWRSAGHPSSVVLKLCDRRFCDSGSVVDAFERPWSPAVEDAFRRAWADVYAGKRAERPVEDSRYLGSGSVGAELA
ncbi:hypothetical protein AURDEDRAFT_160375 [Auricularia subglabra TFB-10046 SS5]|nr:hypothetical protein AURDEDRAFT_160375 [Auricularia subglabra TFB-10046 SS5]